MKNFSEIIGHDKIKEHLQEQIHYIQVAILTLGKLKRINYGENI